MTLSIKRIREELDQFSHTLDRVEYHDCTKRVLTSILSKLEELEQEIERLSMRDSEWEQ